MKSSFVTHFLLLSIILINFSSCINKKLVHGNLPEADLVSVIKIGKDSKKKIVKILGEPSFEGALGDNSFYYYGAVNKKLAFLKPELYDQIILELNFDARNTLDKVFIYDKDNTVNVTMSSKETRYYGYKDSVIRQILSNFGVPGMKRGGPVIGSGRADN